jgi:large subunit ribosomal protein L16
VQRFQHFLHVPPVRPLDLQQKYPKVEYPEKRKLKFMEKIPQPLYGMRMPKMPKNLIDIRGPEEVHTFLVHKQFGIRALQGGNMHHGHFEMVRNGINRKMEESRMFAIWRIDAPWKPITRKGQGHRMGGGKGSIDHYVTPVKGGRIIMEMGGECSFREVFPILQRIAWKLPFKADVVSEESLADEKRLGQQLAEENLNPFSFEYCIQHHSMGCRSWLSPYDYYWHGKYR